MHGLKHRGLSIGGCRGEKLGTPPRLRDLGRRQPDQAIGLHAQQRDSAGHVLEFAVGLSPVQQLADQARQRATLKAWAVGDQCSDHRYLVVAEVPSAVDGLEVSALAEWLKAGARIALSRAAS